MTERKYFGTDGIRGRVGQSPITPDFVLKLGWAVGRVLMSESGRSKVIIGKDTRISGYMFEAALEAGLTAAGVDIELLGPMPTPAIAYLTRTLRAQAGIVISASHNAYHDNGIKFFSGEGFKLADEIELQIEAELDKPMQTVETEQLGRATRVMDAAGRYIEFCKSTIPASVSLKGLKMVVDCANGATYHVAPHVFTELGAEVISIGGQPDGFNINKGCGATHLAALKQAVVAENADLGIAFDGDGDRVMMVDHQGEVVDGDELLFVIVQYMQIKGGADIGGIVGTLMSNFGFEQAVKALGLGFVRANVGDRYVMHELKKTGWSLGGENSGHIICLNKTTTGDGVVSALQVLRAIVETGKSLAELKRGMKKYPQVLLNISVDDRAAAMASTKVAKTVADIETKLAGNGRVLLRPSGTEPVVRVMVEGQDEKTVSSYAEMLADVVKSQ